MELTTHSGHKVSYLSLFLSSLPHLLDILGQLLSSQMSCFFAVQMCLNLTTSFLELSDSVGSLINPRPHSATAVLGVAWGPPTGGEQCPLETSLQVAVDGRATTEQWNLVSGATLWPYDACWQDIQNAQQRGKHHIPLTRACHEVARALATLRKADLAHRQVKQNCGVFWAASYMDGCSTDLSALQVGIRALQKHECAAVCTCRRQACAYSEQLQDDAWISCWHPAAALANQYTVSTPAATGHPSGNHW
ncbi:hypothetical protein Cfor_12053 [Coptotermes formosanus]|uniref:Uncharacterized protein n=1 Tax=Coptotermes formosanus TaxID=36987 RepID=A0A6L2PT33_COPFO|nr:hypothetical protein Cfor_12053 [Coptotermes formosanus]